MRQLSFKGISWRQENCCLLIKNKSSDKICKIGIGKGVKSFTTVPRGRRPKVKGFSGSTKCDFSRSDGV